jgi:hypothetical protein
MAGFPKSLFRVCPVLIGRAENPGKVGFYGSAKPVWGASPGSFGGNAGMAILCNSPLPADSSTDELQAKEAASPAGILTNGRRQTGQDLNRLHKEPVWK